MATTLTLELKRKSINKICHICNKEINYDDDVEYVKTRRSELFVHSACVKNWGKNI